MTLVTTPQADAKVENVLWYTRCPVPTPLGLAAQNGWLADEFTPDGVVVRTLQDTVTESERESHFDHNLPHSFRQGGNIPAIWARARGAATRVIGLSWTDEFQGIITLRSSGIQTVKDLRTRKLGLPVNPISIDFNRATALRAYLTALDLDGVGRGEVEFVDLHAAPVNPVPASEKVIGVVARRGGYGAEIEGLVSGAVDAIFVKGVLGLEVARNLDAVIVVDNGFHPDPLVRVNNGAPRTLTVDQAFLDARPDLVARFLKRVRDAGDWAAEHPDEAAAYIAQEAGGNVESIRKAYGANVHLNLRTDLHAGHIEALSVFKDFLFEEGFLQSDFDVWSWIAPEPLADLLRSA